MAPTPEPAPTLQQLLAFYVEAGVDCALGEEPVNRLADPDTAAPPRVLAQPATRARVSRPTPLAPPRLPPFSPASPNRRRHRMRRSPPHATRRAPRRPWRPC